MLLGAGCPTHVTWSLTKLERPFLRLTLLLPALEGAQKVRKVSSHVRRRAEAPCERGEAVQAAYFVLCHMPSILISSLFMHNMFFLV